MTALFISDLHLHTQRPHITEAFFAFLNHKARNIQSLYILGDLFDTWVGDDDDSDLATSTAKALSDCVENGTNIYFQHGNRDFLLGSDYATASQINLLPELHTIISGDLKILLAHGDQFCTEDTEYQAFRKMVRNSEWQHELLQKSLDERRALAASLREQSKEANSLKAEDIMDVTPSVIVETCRKYDCDLVIHGHTHRPDRHVVDTGISKNNRKTERVVLGDWDTSMWYIELEHNSLDLIEEKI